MSRIALVPSEPLRMRMAGIGIRYLEFARRLPRAGIDLVVLSTVPAETAALDIGAEVRLFERGRLAELLEDCDAVVTQGQLANDVLLEVPSKPTVVDLYDPWLIENLHYVDTLGLDPYRNDHATWVLQLSRGDLFLCSSIEQRQFYLGFLTAVGRVNPEIVGRDPALDSLLAVVPFGVPDELPPHAPYLEPKGEGEHRLLFGGLYDWYDPWPVLRALESLDREEWRLIFISNPNADGTPQRLLGEVERWCRRKGWWGQRVEVLDWVPFERRYDLLRDVDLLVATHQPGIETELSLRTRFLDALAVGCPILTTFGGTLSRRLEEWGAGWLVPPGEPDEVARALREALDDRRQREGRIEAGLRGVAELRWSRILEPLVSFCLEPRREESKERFAVPLPTRAPADAAAFRMRRRLGSWLQWVR